jgi:DNA invertase Pin-like site-specific DNA recombinase
MTMQVIAVVADFGHDLLMERTQSGITRAKVARKQFGRPPALSLAEHAAVVERWRPEPAFTEIAREIGKQLLAQQLFSHHLSRITGAAGVAPNLSQSPFFDYTLTTTNTRK